MSSPFGDDILEDVPIADFQGATLRIDPASGQPSRSVTPNALIGPASEVFADDHKKKTRPSLRSASSDPTGEMASPPSPDSASNFYSGHGMSRSFYQQPPIGKQRRASWHADTGQEENIIHEFFSVRVGAMDKAISDCHFLLDPEIDGDIRGAWLLTEINHWDIEKERVILLCDLSLLVIKYDFIAQRHLHYTRILLRTLEKMQIGELTYPDRSLVPRISGIAGGVVTVIRGVLLNRISNTLARINPWKPAIKNDPSLPDLHSQQKVEEDPSRFTVSSISFEPRLRNMQGVRITWNSNHKISFTQKWNPFCKNIPFTTFTSHPLYWYTGCENNTYDVKSFSKELSLTLEHLEERPDTATSCAISHNVPIVIENYVGIASLLHNVTELGFFKLRGKVSF